MALPSEMTAIGLSKTGPPSEVVEEFKFPVPTPSPTQILIKVHLAGVNYSDTKQIQGAWPMPLPPFPFSLGLECLGTIVSLPTDKTALSDEEYTVRKFAVGTKVVAWSAGKSLSSGTFAEYYIADWSDVYPVPDGIPDRAALASFVAGLTAVPLATESYNVQPGDTVLVHTVAGSVGLAFAQFVKARGGTVIGTTSTREKAALAKQHGADHVIVYKEEDVSKRVLELTGGLGVHAIFDSVGKDTFQTDLASIRAKGTIVWLGFASGPVEPFAPHIMALKAVKYIFVSSTSYMTEKKDGRKYVEEVFKLVASGAYNPAVYKEYPLSAAGVREAEQTMADGKTAGKCLVRVAAD